jgi:hypothetical protein
LGQSGSGISVWPDLVRDAGVTTNFGHETDPIELIVAWTKPEYKDEFIGVGVHALFT